MFVGDLDQLGPTLDTFGLLNEANAVFRPKPRINLSQESADPNPEPHRTPVSDQLLECHFSSHHNYIVADFATICSVRQPCEQSRPTGQQDQPS